MHPTVSIHHALTDLLQSTFFNISQTCFVSSTHFLVHASCSERQMCCLFITWCEWQDFHQFLAPVVRKQFSTRQQANPLGLHCLEEAQCVSGVLPSLFCKYTSELHCPKRDTIWSGLQVKQDSEFSWKWCRTEGGDRRLQTSVLRRGRTPRAEPPRPFVLHWDSHLDRGKKITKGQGFLPGRCCASYRGEPEQRGQADTHWHTHTHISPGSEKRTHLLTLKQALGQTPH